jgi:hypothetical protein
MAKDQAFSLKEIYDGLKSYRGAMGHLAKVAGCNREWIRLVLIGKYTDDALVLKAAKVWLEYAEAEAKQNAQISELVNRARSLQSTVTA